MVVFANIPIYRKISSLFEIFFFDKLSSNKTNIDKITIPLNNFIFFATFAYQELKKVYYEN